jgi:hypothetical protein
LLSPFTQISPGQPKQSSEGIEMKFDTSSTAAASHSQKMQIGSTFKRGTKKASFEKFVEVSEILNNFLHFFRRRKTNGESKTINQICKERLQQLPASGNWKVLTEKSGRQKENAVQS